MITFELLAAAVALGCDAFSVAVGIGALGISVRRIFRLSWHFGFFQFFMPLIGLAMGQLSATFLGQAGQWVAAGCLVLIGFNMIRHLFSPGDQTPRKKDPTRGWLLITLSLSTSVDALIAGFSLGILGVNILIACLVIGLTAGLMTAAGMLIGAGAARALGRWAELFGGLVLIALAIFFIV
jgi:putative Mn2+ efflux pump MntP